MESNEVEKLKELKELEFLATKSSDFIEKQVTSYRHKHTNAGSIITIIALFIPFFLNGLDGSFLLIKILSVIPVIVLLWAMIIFIDVLKTKSLDHGFHTSKFSELINKSHEENLLYEIAANKNSFDDNQKIIDTITASYYFAIKLTVIAIVSSSFLLLLNQFFKPEAKEQTFKVELINSKNMDTERDSTRSGNDEKPESTPERTLPYVPPTDRTNLNDTTPKPNTSDQSRETGER